MGDFQVFFNAISNFGFPVVVAGYLLFRNETKMDKLQDTINKLSENIQILTVTINSKRKI